MCGQAATFPAGHLGLIPDLTTRLEGGYIGCLQCTLKRSVVILTQKVLFQHQNKHLLVTVFKHVSAFMHNTLMSFQTPQHLFDSESVFI